jgi:nicotinamidase-related amidase
MRFDKVLLDIEVQRDLFSPGGACANGHSAEAAKNVRKLFLWARRQSVPVLSTVLRMRRNHIGPLAPVPHCIEGTVGEQRPPGTVMPRYVNLGIRGTTDLPMDIFHRYQQVIIEKRDTNIFEHPRAERLLTELKAETFVVCGAGSAGGVIEVVIGLGSRGFKVVLASDAILDLGDPRAEMAWLRMLAKGAVPLSTGEIVALPQPHRPGRGHYSQCAAMLKTAEAKK